MWGFPLVVGGLIHSFERITATKSPTKFAVENISEDHLERFLALGVGHTPADFLSEESTYSNCDGMRRPIDALKAGAIDVVIAAAKSFLDAFT